MPIPSVTDPDKKVFYHFLLPSSSYFLFLGPPVHCLSFQPLPSTVLQKLLVTARLLQRLVQRHIPENVQSLGDEVSWVSKHGYRNLVNELAFRCMRKWVVCNVKWWAVGASDEEKNRAAEGWG